MLAHSVLIEARVFVAAALFLHALEVSPVRALL